MTKYDDLVKTLRTSIFRSGMTDKAADAIEALQAEAHAAAIEAACSALFTYARGLPYGTEKAAYNAAGDLVSMIHTDTSRAAIERIKRETREEALREAIETCNEEHLEDTTKDEGDAAYTRAVSDCIAAITALIEKDHPMTEQTAPDRVWMDPDIKFPECETQYGCDVEYVRIEELEAKLANTVAFLEFLDGNYRHVFGDTARAKIRELYAELKGQGND